MNASTLSKVANDPAAFRAMLTIPGGRGPVKFASAMAEFQRVDFAKMDGAFVALSRGTKPDVGRFWLERTKGASKDSDLAVMLLWLLAFSPRLLACQIGAADADQADELRKAAKAILRLNPWLGELVDIQAWSIINRRTDSRCDILAADVAGSHGARPDLLILNELSHVGKREFAENLVDNAAKVPHGVVVIATNAGFTPSWQWDWRENAREQAGRRWHFSAFKQPAPWLDPAEIDEAKRRNSAARFNRLWGGDWTSGDGDALTGSDIAAATRLQTPYGADWKHLLRHGWLTFAGCDLGIRRDRSALVVIGARGQKVQLLSVEAWAPPAGGKLDLMQVEEAILRTCVRLNPYRLLVDVWQAELLGQRLASHGVNVETVAFTSTTMQEMATATLEKFHSGNVELYPDAALLADLHAMRFLDKGTSYRVDFPRTSAGHGDRGTAYLLANLAAARNQAATTYLPIALEEEGDDLAAHRERLANDASYAFHHG